MGENTVTPNIHTDSLNLIQFLYNRMKAGGGQAVISADDHELQALISAITTQHEQTMVCPWCGEREARVVSKENAHRVRCPRCQSTGPVVSSVEFARKTWESQVGAVHVAVSTGNRIRRSLKTSQLVVLSEFKSASAQGAREIQDYARLTGRGIASVRRYLHIFRGAGFVIQGPQGWVTI